MGDGHVMSSGGMTDYAVCDSMLATVLVGRHARKPDMPVARRDKIGYGSLDEQLPHCRHEPSDWFRVRARARSERPAAPAPRAQITHTPSFSNTVPSRKTATDPTYPTREVQR